MAKPLRIKFLARTPADQDPALWLSLFPGGEPVIGNTEFTFDPKARDYDWLAVYEDLMFLPGQSRSNRIEKLACARENTLFITTEPASIKVYGRHYLRQFGHVLSVQPKAIIAHPSQIYETPPLRWFYGRPLGDGGGQYRTVDSLKSTRPIPKNKDISIVCSNKVMSKPFHQRYDFAGRAKAAFKDNLDWYGRGVRPIDDKAEALDDYRYHITFENHIAPGHFTEKIMDAFLGYCLPVYDGPPDIGKFFPPDAILPISLSEPEAAIEILQKAAADRLYEKRLPAITEARRRTLENYNLMTRIAQTAKARHQSIQASPRSAAIMGRHIFRAKHPIKALFDAGHAARQKLLS